MSNDLALDLVPRLPAGSVEHQHQQHLEHQPIDGDIEERTPSGGRARNRHAVWIVLAVIVLALAARLARVDVPTNTDEFHWLERGIDFMAALTSGDLSATYQRHHPGVTNMWIVGSALAGRQVMTGINPLSPSSWSYDYLRDQLGLLNLLVTARVLAAIVTAATFAGFYLLSRRLFGGAVALLATLTLLLEPFYLAYQRSITTDANQTNFAWLSFLAFLLIWQQRRQPTGTEGADVSRKPLPWGWITLSGVFFGLALLSKVSALLMLPAFAIWAIRQTARLQHGPSRWLALLGQAVLWGTVVAGTVLALWPALWVDLPGTIARFRAGMAGELAGHTQFFLGEVTDSPSAAFYPLVLLFRTTPLLLAGFLLGLVSLFARPLQRFVLGRAEAIAICINLAVVVVALTANATKLDRYIVPMLPGLALIAAVGIWALAAFLADRWPAVARTPSAWLGLTLLVVVVIQAVAMLPHYPYYLTYYNPLLGGPARAQKALMVGNGELLDQAASWLNKEPEAGNAVAVSWYYRSFSPYFDGYATKFSELGKDQVWVHGNYAVLYVNQLQRQLPIPELVAYVEAQQPLHIVRSHGVDYAVIYPGPTARPGDLDQLADRPNLEVDGFAQLVGYELAPSELGPGIPGSIVLYWQVAEPIPAGDYLVNLLLLDEEGRPVGENGAPPVAGLFPVEQWPPGQTIRDVQQLDLPPDLSPGSYALAIGVYAERNGHWLEIRGDQGSLGTHAPLASLTIAPKP